LIGAGASVRFSAHFGKSDGVKLKELAATTTSRMRSRIGVTRVGCCLLLRNPTPEQVRALASHAGASRKAFNWALGLVKAQLDQRDAERSYGIPAAELTPFVSWSLPSLRKRWNEVKAEVAPWWAECSKEAYSAGIRNLVRGLDAWRDPKAGRRKGPPVRFPRFKSKRRETLSCTFTTGTIRIEADRRHVTLPRLGRLRLHESARKLARRIDAGTGRILSATVRRGAGRWFVSLACEVDKAERISARPHAVVGVDVGVSHLAVLSTGEIVANPRHLTAAGRHLRRIARRMSRRAGSDRRTGCKPSKRWLRAKAELGRAHARVANQRRDALHKLTSRLAATYGTVVVEHLNVASMVRNRRLARAISDCGFAAIRQQLAYKTVWNGGRLVVADRWFPSSKTCSDCGAVKAKPEGSNGRGVDRKTPLAGQVTAKRPPGTASVGQTGTVPPQGGTSYHALTRAR
jgi:IS605 OrfB family transposase